MFPTDTRPTVNVLHNGFIRSTGPHIHKLHTFTLRCVPTGWNGQETSKVDIQKCEKIEKIGKLPRGFSIDVSLEISQKCSAFFRIPLTICDQKHQVMRNSLSPSGFNIEFLHQIVEHLNQLLNLGNGNFKLILLL